MNIHQILEKFATEEKVVNHLEQIRWAGKPRCPKCKSIQVYGRFANFRYKCKSCESSFTVTTDTHLHNTRLNLQKWILAFALISDAKKGVSALQLQRHIGVTYVTAFAMSHKIRDIMAIEKVDILEDIVEMDETFIGGKPRKPNVREALTKNQIDHIHEGLQTIKDAGLTLKRGKGNPARIDINTKRGRGSQKQIPIAGIVERDGAVIAQVMENLKASELKALVEKHVNSENAVLITDTYKGYNGLHKIIEHIRIDHSKMYSYKGINTNSIESFWAIVERGIMGTYHSVSLKYLPKYVVEFVFKYNNRKHDDMFETLVKASMKVPIPNAIIHPPKKKKQKLPF
jgi:transposase-like protein